MFEQAGHRFDETRLGPCRERGPAAPALLLVLDDFEQLLEEAPGVRPVRTAQAGLIAAILGAFDPATTDSRLIVTSRFPFRLTTGRADLAGRLARIELPSFQPTTERKLLLRQEQSATPARLAAVTAPADDLLSRALAAARGNPGLQDLLITRLLLNAAVPLPAAAEALAQMEAYLAGGDLPGDETVRALLEGIAVDALIALAGDGGRVLLQAMGLCDLPVPRTLAAELGGDLQRLTDLALAEPGEDPVTGARDAVRLSPLARARLPALGEADRAAVARLAVGPLYAAWGGAGGERPWVADWQLGALALAARDALIAADCGAATICWLEDASYAAAAGFAGELVGLIEGAGEPLPPLLVAQAARVIGAAGNGSGADALLAQRVAALGRGGGEIEAGALLLIDAHASRLFQRGDLDAALRIRREVELPVYQRLGDVRSKAVTEGQIADILTVRGDIGEALRIRTEEQLPVYERLGDLRAKAITQGKIADIFKARGDLDAALPIYTDEELPVYQRLGDLRLEAVCQGKIADILQTRGDLDEALRIRTAEQLPVYERLGDVCEKAICQGRIAEILAARGDLDAALSIRTLDELPVYERLGDVRELLACRTNIAIILLKRLAQTGRREDAPEANRLLCLALAEARRLRLPMEAGEIESILQQVGMQCPDPS